MIRAILVLLTAAALCFPDVLDRNGALSSREEKHLNQICSSILRNSGEVVHIVFLNSSDSIQSVHLSREFARELKLYDRKEWILALIAADGSVHISMSKGLNEQVLPDHAVTLSDGTKAVFQSGESARAAEFLLLNIADILAEKNGIELSRLLEGGDFSESRFSSEFILFILLLIVGSSVIFTIVRRNVSMKSAGSPASCGFGGTLSEGESDLFGTASRKNCR